MALQSQLRAYLLTHHTRTSKIPQFEYFMAIMHIYAKQNGMQPEQVLNYVFKQLSQPTELHKLRDMARDLLKSKSEPVDDKEFPHLAFL